MIYDFFFNIFHCDVQFAIADWVILAALALSAVVSTVGAVATNSTNREIAARNNQTQVHLFEEANAFNKQEREEAQQFEADQIREQRAYNEPIAQASRLSAAGLNPGAVLGGDAAKMLGAATSSPASSVSVPSLTSPTMQNPVDGNLLMDAVMKYGNFREMQIDTELKNEDLKVRANENILKIMNAQEDLRGKIANRSLTEEQRNYYIEQEKNLEQMRKAMVLQLSRDQKAAVYDDQNYKNVADKLNSEALSAAIDYEDKKFLHELNLKYGDKIKQSELDSILAGINEMRASAADHLASANLSKQQKKKVYEETREATVRWLNEWEKHKGIKLDNDLKRKIEEYQIESIKKHVRQQGADYWNPFRYLGQVLGGAGTQAIKTIAK